MTKTLTDDMLKQAYVGEPGLDRFERQFPDGATWDELIATLEGKPDWAARARYGRVCPAEVEGATLEARLALQRTDEERAEVKERFKGVIDGC